MDKDDLSMSSTCCPCSILKTLYENLSFIEKLSKIAEFLCIYSQIPMMLTLHKYMVITETRR